MLRDVSLAGCTWEDSEFGCHPVESWVYVLSETGVVPSSLILDESVCFLVYKRGTIISVIEVAFE